MTISRCDRCKNDCEKLYYVWYHEEFHVAHVELCDNCFNLAYELLHQEVVK